MTATNNTTLIDLASTDLPATVLGGKAAGLARLAAAGFPVPEAAVVPAGIADADLDRLGGELAARFPGRRLAVRSSGVAEDGREASFAGQYETVLDVPAELPAIVAALRRVRASAGQTPVVAYGHGAERRMAVLVMPMVDAEAAGIAFTRDPITGERAVIIEAVDGVADRLAAGEETGERWTVSDEPVCRNPRGVLTSGQATEVASLARRIEETDGVPVDVEWAIAAGEVILLQARPITTLDDVEPIPIDGEPPPGPWEWDSTHNRTPVTPLSSSVFMPAFEEGSLLLVEHYGAPFGKLAMATIDGYLYIQVVPPAGKAGSPTPPAPLMKALFKVLPPLRRRERTARRALTERIDRTLATRWRDEIRPGTEAALDEWWSLDRSTLTDAELMGHLGDAVEEQRSTFRWNMVTDPAYLLPLADLYDFVTARLDEGMEAVTWLLAGSSRSEYRTSLRSLEDRLSVPARDAIVAGDGAVLDRLEEADPHFTRAYREHLQAHGTRILGFDLSASTLLEDPQSELSRLVALPPDEDPTPDAERLTGELRSRLDPDAAVRFDELVAEARATYPIREEGEAVHARAMGAVRLAALEAGQRMAAAGHLDDPEHVVFLSLGEVTAWLEARVDRRDLVRHRRGQHRWAIGHSPAPYVGGEPNTPDPSMFPPAVARIFRIYDLVMSHDARPVDLDAEADGVAASPGIHTGPVRIVRGPQDFAKVHPGDVLVAPITTSPWEVLFPTVGALVTEGGGLLSHPAIVAREYRLPAVVGCEGATSRFHDGQLVTVDGTAGTVTPIE